MRITSVMMGNSYRRNLQASQQRLNEASLRSTDFLKFHKVSDDPASASKGFQLRREISRVNAQVSNAEMMEGRINTAESALVNVQEQLKDVKDRLIQGNNGTFSAENRSVIAEEMRGIQKAIIQDMNISYTGQHLFGGEKTDEAPLSADENGKLLFRGQSLEQLPNESDKDFKARMAKLEDEMVLIDFGYGLEAGNSESGFDVSLSAVDFLGYGVDESGTPTNLYNLIGEMADYLENNDDSTFDPEFFGKYIEQYDDSHDNFLNALTNMGQKAHTIEYTKTRLSASLKSLQEKQSYVEAVEPAEALNDFKYEEFAFRAALTIGTKILQPSLLDFLG